MQVSAPTVATPPRSPATASSAPPSEEGSLEQRYAALHARAQVLLERANRLVEVERGTGQPSPTAPQQQRLMRLVASMPDRLTPRGG